MTIQVVKHRPSASRFDERALTKSIGQSLLRDRFFLRGRLKRLGDDARAGRDVATALEDLTRRIENSLQQVEMRRAAVPVLNYPEELPVSARCEEIVAAIRDHPVLIVCGETGSGKTTQLPKLCLEAGRGVFGMIGHTQPRRLAARTVAARIAEELGQPLGKAVGYKIRFQ
ncbi:MAG TPA: ATP-dependent RNA helicase HrpA, partial [Methylococcaceae bacterium]|nr:ATP-dependent RNA helicase HrpA [Methylococcaceae bacterium]